MAAGDDSSKVDADKTKRTQELRNQIDELRKEWDRLDDHG